MAQVEPKQRPLPEVSFCYWDQGENEPAFIKGEHMAPAEWAAEAQKHVGSE